jgi:hypothetical protein
MKKSIQLIAVVCLFTIFGCKQNSKTPSETTTENTATQGSGQSAVVDEAYSPNIVQL